MIANLIKLGALLLLWQVLTALQNAIMAGYGITG
jgi:hypothetical protein